MKLLSKVLPAAALFLSINLFSEEPQQFVLHEMNHQNFLEIFQDKAPSTIVKVEAGTRLPVRLSTTGSVFSIDDSGVDSTITTLVVNIPLYVKIIHFESDADCSLCDSAENAVSQPEMVFSIDQITWKPFEELFTGNLFVAISSDEESTSPFANICLDLNLRN